MPKQWVVDCRHAGRGESALEYLSRYLYRGVIGESNILGDNAGRVSFRYTDGETGEIRIETLPGEAFLWRIVQHVLPRGFHRIRDYGFLHHNARKTLQLIQLILQVALKAVAPEEAIATMGSAGFLLLFMAGNLANVRLARETGSRAWISGLAALSTAIALIVLCVEVDENPATRNHLWILAGMILVSFAIELVYRSVTGREIRLVWKPAKGGPESDRR